MDEIERIIALVKTFDSNNVVVLDMKYSFLSIRHSDDFFVRVAESNFCGDLIAAKNTNNAHVAGLRVIVPLEVNTLRELCHHYRQLAYEFEGIPLKWALRVKT
tara:strand:- start:1600 stop:1908 length:309 start_codon:yes stop_codon:yes gene_type:complete